MKLAEKMRRLNEDAIRHREKDMINYITRLITRVAKDNGKSFKYILRESDKDINWAYIQKYYTDEGFSVNYYVNERFELRW